MSSEKSQGSFLVGVGAAGLLTAVAGLGFSAMQYAASPEQFTRSYLPAYIYWLGVALGGLALRMLHGLTGGSWGVVLRRVLESAAKTVPFMAVLALPIFLGMRHLYPWLDPHEMDLHPILMKKVFYLNEPGFLMRSGVYFAAWILLTFLVTFFSGREDGVEGSPATRRFQGICGVGLIVYAMTLTFAAVDWVMSLEPEWYSTIYGLHFLVGQGVSILAFSIVVVWLFSGRGFFRLVTADHYHDFGNLLFAFVLLWTYMALSQFLIIWSGNLPEEISWYISRFKGGWDKVGILLVGVHFVLPFFLLLLRAVKRKAAYLGALALFMLAVHFLDLFWYIKPAFSPARFALHPLDLTLWIGLGGLWVVLFSLFFGTHRLPEPASAGRSH